MTKRKATHCDEDVLGGDDHEDEDSHDDDDDGADIDCSSSKKAGKKKSRSSKLQPKLKKPKRSYSSSLLSQQKQTKKQEQEEGGDSDTVNTVTATATATSTTTTALYVDEVVQPEWIALPQELAMIDFHHYYKENAEEKTPNATPPRLPPAAWGKYAPYYQLTQQLPITPIQTPPIFTPKSPALCYYLNGLDGRARCGTLHFPSAGPPVTTPRFMPVGTKGVSFHSELFHLGLRVLPVGSSFLTRPKRDPGSVVRMGIFLCNSVLLVGATLSIFSWWN